jgi:hypothetical protein
MGTLRIRRQHLVWRDRIVHYAVVVDGRRVGKVGNGQTKDFLLPAGHHSVRIRVMRILRSKESSIVMEDTQTIEMACRPQGPLGTLLFFLRPHRYIIVDIK